MGEIATGDRDAENLERQGLNADDRGRTKPSMLGSMQHHSNAWMAHAANICRDALRPLQPLQYFYMRTARRLYGLFSAVKENRERWCKAPYCLNVKGFSYEEYHYLAEKRDCWK